MDYPTPDEEYELMYGEELDMMNEDGMKVKIINFMLQIFIFLILRVFKSWFKCCKSSCRFHSKDTAGQQQTHEHAQQSSFVANLS